MREYAWPPTHTDTRAPAEICGVNADPQQTWQPAAIKRCSEEPEGPRSQRTRSCTYMERARLVQYVKCNTAAAYLNTHTHRHTPSSLAANRCTPDGTVHCALVEGVVWRSVEEGGESEGDWIKLVAAGGDVSMLIRGGDSHPPVSRLLCLTMSTPCIDCVRLNKQENLCRSFKSALFITFLLLLFSSAFKREFLSALPVRLKAPSFGGQQDG